MQLLRNVGAVLFEVVGVLLLLCIVVLYMVALATGFVSEPPAKDRR